MVAESAELVAESVEAAAELEGDAVTSMVVPAAPLALAVAEGVGVLEEGTALGDASGDRLRLAVALGVPVGLVAGVALACDFAEAVPFVLLAVACVAFADGLLNGAVRVTAGAMLGDRVPAALCQANATDPPAGTSSPPTPELA